MIFVYPTYNLSLMMSALYSYSYSSMIFTKGGLFYGKLSISLLFHILFRSSTLLDMSPSFYCFNKRSHRDLSLTLGVLRCTSNSKALDILFMHIRVLMSKLFGSCYLQNFKSQFILLSHS